MSSPPHPIVRCREIDDSDINDIIDLAMKRYSDDRRHESERGFNRLARRPVPPNFPKYGYLLEVNGISVGYILLIFFNVKTANSYTTRCNIAGFYIEPRYSMYARLLHSHAIKCKDITYMCVPGPLIRPITESLGFTRYSDGQFAAVPLLSSPARDTQVAVIDVNANSNVTRDSFEQELLSVHAEYGCICLWCTTAGQAFPFMFVPVNVKGFIPCARLTYCRSVDDFVRFARPLGNYLVKRGRPFVLIDANGQIPGLVGKYFKDSRPKYFKGPTRPRLGDLAYTHHSMFETESPVNKPI